MVSLRPIRQDEFSAFLDYFIQDYATEITINYRLPQQDALAQATRDAEQSFPQAQETADQIVVCITLSHDDVEQHIGYFWYKADTVLKSAYINDFCIFERFRRQGYGSAAMKALEKKLTEEGFIQLKLRVAEGNQYARQLYSANGFCVTGINMNKLLSGE